MAGRIVPALLVLSICWAMMAAVPANAGDAEEGTGEESGAEYNRISIDPHFSLETGADLTFALSSGAAALEAFAFRSVDLKPASGVPVRLLRTVLLDHPLAYWLVVLQHEGFGHGGRAREFGSSADIHMGSPWSGRSSYATFETEGLTDEELLRIYTGGSESNGWSATLLERELVAGRAMHHFELLYLIRSRLVTSFYVLDTTPDPVTEPLRFYGEWRGGGDVARYLGYLNAIHHGDPGITPDGASPTVAAEYDRLRRQAVWNALDPGVWLAGWMVCRNILYSDAARQLPLPKIAGRRFLPVLSADWLPHGGVISLEAVFGSRAGQPDSSRWFSFTVRRGDGPAGSFGALGAAKESVWRSPHVRIGGEVEAWIRPGGRLGGGARLRVSFARRRWGRLFVDRGVKSAGHWPGRPAGHGLIVRAGALRVAE